MRAHWGLDKYPMTEELPSCHRWKTKAQKRSNKTSKGTKKWWLSTEPSSLLSDANNLCSFYSLHKQTRVSSLSVGSAFCSAAHSPPGKEYVWVTGSQGAWGIGRETLSTMGPRRALIYWEHFFFFGRTHVMKKFPGQGMNPHHSSNQSLSSDKAGSLTLWPWENTWEHLPARPVPRAHTNLMWVSLTLGS